MSKYKTIHTNYGLSAQARAKAAKTPINLTHMAVGDGNGNPIVPSETQTSLRRELFRAPINRIFQDPAAPNKFTAEVVIPATVGGFVLREFCILDETGGVYAVGNLPDTYKPVASEGAFSDTIVRCEFIETNADVVNVFIDPNIAVATHQWVLNNVTACAIIPGGTAGQVLRKRTNACGDTEWYDPADANVVVDIIEETQTLAAGQTAVMLNTCTTNGLAVYIDGVRLRAGQWTAPDATNIKLSTSYPAGTKIVAVQNEPAGIIAYPVDREKNLQDVPDKALARAHLEVFSKAESRQLSPAGQVSFFACQAAPPGWLKADGTPISRTAYPDLFTAIGTTYGAGDGFNTFNLPDLRGEFLRGFDASRGVDKDREFGSFQSDSFQQHTHIGSVSVFGKFSSVSDTSGNIQPIVTNNGDVNSGRASSETRPRNIALLACIKY